VNTLNNKALNSARERAKRLASTTRALQHENKPPAEFRPLEIVSLTHSHTRLHQPSRSQGKILTHTHLGFLVNENNPRRNGSKRHVTRCTTTVGGINPPIVLSPFPHFSVIISTDQTRGVVGNSHFSRATIIQWASENSRQSTVEISFPYRVSTTAGSISATSLPHYCTSEDRFHSSNLRVS